MHQDVKEAFGTGREDGEPDISMVLREAFAPGLVKIDFHDADGTVFDPRAPGAPLPRGITLVHEIPWAGREILALGLAAPAVSACLLDPRGKIAAGKVREPSGKDGHGEQGVACRQGGQPGSQDMPSSPSLRAGELAFIDIETLGLENEPVVLVGVGRLARDRVRIEQHILLDASGEGRFLDQAITRFDFHGPSTVVFLGPHHQVYFQAIFLDLARESRTRSGTRQHRLMPTRPPCCHLPSPCNTGLGIPGLIPKGTRVIHAGITPVLVLGARCHAPRVLPLPPGRSPMPRTTSEKDRTWIPSKVHVVKSRTLSVMMNRTP